MANVRLVDDVFRVHRLAEARPAGAGVELVDRAEQWFPTHDVYVQPGLMIVPKAISEGRLGSIALGNLVLERAQARAKLIGRGLCVGALCHFVVPFSASGDRPRRATVESTLQCSTWLPQTPHAWQYSAGTIARVTGAARATFQLLFYGATERNDRPTGTHSKMSERGGARLGSGA